MTALVLNKLSHIALNVTDIEESLAFYQNVLGLSLIFRQELPHGMGYAAGLRLPSGDALELLQLLGGEGKPKEVNTAEQCTRVVFSVADIAEAKQSLIEGGFSDLNEMELDGIKMLFFQDPDQRTIELAEYPNAASSLAELY